MSEPWLDGQDAGDDPRVVEPLELPAAGETGTGMRPSAAAPTDALSIQDAGARYGISASTLRRRLQRGEIAGAFRVTGAKGEEWRLPRGARIPGRRGDRDDARSALSLAGADCSRAAA